MKRTLLPVLLGLAMLGTGFEAAAHDDGYRDRYRESPRHGHYKPGHHMSKNSRHHGHAYRAPVVVVPAPRHYGHYDRRPYRPDYRHHHHARCGHGYRGPEPYGIAFGTNPYGSWLDIRIGY